MIRIIGVVGILFILFFILNISNQNYESKDVGTPFISATSIPAKNNPNINKPEIKYVPEVVASNSVTSEKNSQKKKLSQEAVSNRVKSLLKEVTSKINLSENEQELVSNSLREKVAQQGRILFRDERNEILKSQLGEKKYSEFEEIERDIETNERARDLDSKVIVIGRRAGLSFEQENTVRNILQAVDVELEPQKNAVREQMKEAMSQHYDGASGKDKLKESYDVIQQASIDLKTQQEESVSERLKGVLPDEKIKIILQELEG